MATDRHLLHIEMEDYLAQWFIHEQGEESPVTLIRGSIESHVLETFLQVAPKDYVPDFSTDGKLSVIIPHFRSKDPAYYHYLPTHARKLFVSVVRNRFDIQMWQTLHRFSNQAVRQDECIWAFMEKHGIEMTDTNWNAIAKRYQRKRQVYLAVERKRLANAMQKKSKK